MQQETIKGSLFPLLPLRVKCQNHERVPISPISPILVVHVLTRWKNMEDQNRGNRDPLMVLALHPGKTLRGSLFPLAPKGEVPKPWEGPYFPYFPYFHGQCLDIWRDMEIGEIGTLSAFSLGEVPKPWEGPYFPYFGGPCLDKMGHGFYPVPIYKYEYIHIFHLLVPDCFALRKAHNSHPNGPQIPIFASSNDIQTLECQPVWGYLDVPDRKWSDQRWSGQWASSPPIYPIYKQIRLSIGCPVGSDGKRLLSGL